MCMICNLPNHPEVASEYLTAYSRAQAAMKKATKLMAAARDAAPDAITRDIYDANHKRMVRITRDWNRTDHQREPSIGCTSVKGIARDPRKIAGEARNTPES